MIKVIFTFPNGLPSYVCIPGTPDAYVNGQTYGNCVARIVDTTAEDTVILSTWHWVNSEWATHTAQPDIYHTLNTETFTWEITQQTITTTYEKVIKSIKDLREAKDIQNISYTGKVLQVDLKSQNNITGRLDAIACQLALNLTVDPATLFWRDVANVTHYWTDVTEYANWLRGLIVVYSARRGALYYRSWEHGAALKAIFDNNSLSASDKLNSILSYDITTGW
jgi:hypothetical protein